MHSCSAQAIGSVALKSIPLSRLYQLAAKDPSFALVLYKTVSAQLGATRDLLVLRDHIISAIDGIAMRGGIKSKAASKAAAMKEGKSSSVETPGGGVIPTDR